MTGDAGRRKMLGKGRLEGEGTMSQRLTLCQIQCQVLPFNVSVKGFKCCMTSTNNTRHAWFN